MLKEMKLLKLYIVTLVLTTLSFSSKSQIIGAGASAIYNFQSESFGAGVRVSIFPNKRLSFTPQFSYFFPFNKVNEYTIGLGIEGKIIKRKKVNIYALIHGGYNAWLNYKLSGMKDAKATNWNLEGGIGISTNTCLRPFLEYRYNVKFLETHLDLGFIYIFGCKNKYLDDTRCPSFN